MTTSATSNPPTDPPLVSGKPSTRHFAARRPSQPRVRAFNSASLLALISRTICWMHPTPSPAPMHPGSRWEVHWKLSRAGRQASCSGHSPTQPALHCSASRSSRDGSTRRARPSKRSTTWRARMLGRSTPKPIVVPTTERRSTCRIVRSPPTRDRPNCEPCGATPILIPTNVPSTMRAFSRTPPAAGPHGMRSGPG